MVLGAAAGRCEVSFLPAERFPAELPPEDLFRRVDFRLPAAPFSDALIAVFVMSTSCGVLGTGSFRRRYHRKSGTRAGRGGEGGLFDRFGSDHGPPIGATMHACFAREVQSFQLRCFRRSRGCSTPDSAMIMAASAMMATSRVAA